MYFQKLSRNHRRACFLEQAHLGREKTERDRERERERQRERDRQTARVRVGETESEGVRKREALRDSDTVR